MPSLYMEATGREISWKLDALKDRAARVGLCKAEENRGCQLSLAVVVVAVTKQVVVAWRETRARAGVNFVFAGQ